MNDLSNISIDYGDVVSDQLTIVDTFWGILLCFILATAVQITYQLNADSLSNKKSFAKQFFLIATIVMIVISVVKSSIALSLGLVGALSIVRFRTAIKEPEELSYIFLAIGISKW